MNPKPLNYEALIESLADGASLDWTAIERKATTPAERNRYQNLRLVARVREAVIEAAVPESVVRQNSDQLGLINVTAKNITELMAAVSQGLSSSTLQDLSRKSGLSLEVLARTLHISPVTIKRRRRLTPLQSESVVRLARVFAAVRRMVEGDTQAAREWLTSSQLALGGAAPIELLTSEVGSRAVEELIGRIEDGIGL